MGSETVCTDKQPEMKLIQNRLDEIIENRRVLNESLSRICRKIKSLPEKEEMPAPGDKEAYDTMEMLKFKCMALEEQNNAMSANIHRLQEIFG